MGFRAKVILLIFLSIAFGLMAFYFALMTPFWLLAGWMVIFLVITVFSLIRITERSDRDLSNFLLAIRQNDFTATYPSKVNKTNRLYYAFNIITSEFIRLRSEKESNFHFLKTVVEHSGVPLISYTTGSEQITLINQAAKELFGIPHMTKLGSLERVSTDLVGKIRELHSEDRILMQVQLKNETVYLSVVVRELVLQEQRNKVVAFHNINSELDQKEVESWQKLIRVMTHEIKNSVIPISTLAEVVNAMMHENEVESNGFKLMSEEEIKDLLLSVNTIEKRSKGLVKFVTNYGDLAKVPKPEFEKTDLCSLVHGVVKLEERLFQKTRIEMSVSLPSRPVYISIDSEMIEQVLINLLKNSVEAFSDSSSSDSKIQISLDQKPNQVLLAIQDNGPGMDKETQENIFIPFFTTKKDGSGIGLSYSKQILRAHKGTIRVRSEVGKGSVFEVIFPK